MVTQLSRTLEWGLPVFLVCLLGDKTGLITTVLISNSPCGLNTVKERGCGMPARCLNIAQAVDASEL